MSRLATPDLSDEQIDRLRHAAVYLLHTFQRATTVNGFDPIMEMGTAAFLECEDILREIGDEG